MAERWADYFSCVAEEKPESIRELEDILLLVIIFFTLVTWILAMIRLLLGSAG